MVRYRDESNALGDHCWCEDILVEDGASGTGPRTMLTYDELISGADPGAPFATSAFEPSSNAGPPSHVFEGTLAFIDEAILGTTEAVVDDFGYMNGKGNFVAN